MEGEQKRMLGFLVDPGTGESGSACANAWVGFEPGIFFSCAYHFGGMLKGIPKAPWFAGMGTKKIQINGTTFEEKLRFGAEL